MSKRQASNLALDSIVRRVKAFREEEKEKGILSRGSSAFSLEQEKTAIQCLIEDTLYSFTGGDLAELFLSCAGWNYIVLCALALSTKRTWLKFKKTKLYFPFVCPVNELSESLSSCVWAHNIESLISRWKEQSKCQYISFSQHSIWERNRKTDVLELIERYHNWLLCPQHFIKGCSDCVGEDHIEGTVCILCAEDEEKELQKEEEEEEEGEEEKEDSDSEEEEKSKADEDVEEKEEEEKEEDSDVEVVGEVHGLPNRENPIVIEDDDADTFKGKVQARAYVRAYRAWGRAHKEPIYIDLINI